MGKIKPGALYVGSGRRYVDSQALHNIARTHEVVEMQGGGWRILGADGVVACSLVNSRSPLPQQRGSLYEVSAAHGVLLSMARTWVAHGQLSIHEAPAEPARASCGGCGAACACGPCQHKHGHGTHEHDPREGAGGTK
ncbi:hypothetical protein [Nannocystis sp.]|uniref:hypothetical protein n=1 Tax=Nannocystis sp. TaxID=1962667 RepID=UPI0025EAF7CA|nr:hypothetical protein [Nannocystis sp.]MBK7828597.1 hypothetical protein [Nannocystis sp.]